METYYRHSGKVPAIGVLFGFLAGVLFGALLTFWPNRLAENALANRVTELVCAGLVGVTWWLALESLQ